MGYKGMPLYPDIMSLTLYLNALICEVLRQHVSNVIQSFSCVFFFERSSNIFRASIYKIGRFPTR